MTQPSIRKEGQYRAIQYILLSSDRRYGKFTCYLPAITANQLYLLLFINSSQRGWTSSTPADSADFFW